MRALAIVLLCYPLLTGVIVALFYFIPGLNDYISKVFWELLGDKIPIFSMASNLLEEFTSYEKISTEQLGVAYLQLIVKGVYDAVFFGCCIFFLKSLFFFLRKVKTQKYKFFRPTLSRSDVFLDVVGIFIGVSLRPLLNQGTVWVRSVLQASVPIIMLAYGVKRIWTSTDGIKGSHNEKKTQASRKSFLLRRLLEILINAGKAVATISLITCIMESPRLLHSGRSVVPVLVWGAAFFGLLVFLEAISD